MVILEKFKFQNIFFKNKVSKYLKKKKEKKLT